MASMAGETDFVKKPAWPESSAKPKVTRPPAPSSRGAARPKPASIATLPRGGKDKPVDMMEIARRIKLAGHAR